jgi:colanic acid/amylovoran biosynthesis protein
MVVRWSWWPLSPERVKVCILGASFRSGASVGALTAGIIRCILSWRADAEITLLDYGDEVDKVPYLHNGRRVWISIANARFSKRFYLKNNIALLLLKALLLRVLPVRIGSRLIARNPVLHSIHEAGIVGSVAGGDSFSDIYGIPRFLYTILPQLLVLALGKPLVQLPQTYGPFKNIFVRAIARQILKRSALVYSREGNGFRHVETLGLKANASKFKFCYDLGCVLEPVPPGTFDVSGLTEKVQTSAFLTGVNVSGLLAMGGYSRRNMFGLRADYVALVEQIITFLIKTKGGSVVLIPHVLGDHGEGDSGACQGVYESLHSAFPGRLAILERACNSNELKAVIGRCDLFIGSRMHACIAATTQCIPTVSLSYSEKFAGVMGTMGMESLVADLKTMDERQVLDVVQNAVEHRDELRSQLEHRIPKVRERALGVFGEIARDGVQTD